MLFLGKKRAKLLGFLLEYDSYTVKEQLVLCQDYPLLLKVFEIRTV